MTGKDSPHVESAGFFVPEPLQPCDTCRQPLPAGRLCPKCQTPILHAHRKARAKFRRLTLIFERSLAKDRAHIVLIGMAYHAGLNGICEITTPDLAKWCRVTVIAVRRGMAELQRLGEIMPVTKRIGRGTANAYLVTVLKPLTVSTFSDHKAAHCEHL